MAQSQLAQLTLYELLIIFFGGLTGAFVGLCCGLVASSIDPRPGLDDTLGLGGAFFGAIAGALGGAIKRVWLVTALASIGPLLFLLPLVVIDEIAEASREGSILVIAAVVGGASGGVIRGRMAGSCRFTFRLTTSFWLVFVVAITCGLLAINQQQKERWRQQRVAELGCRQLDVLIKFRRFQCIPDFGPRGSIVGLRLVALTSNERGDPNDELIQLKELPGWLGRLTIEGRAFNDAGMTQLGAMLEGFRGLPVYELGLNGTQITDAGLAHLEGKSNLRSLNLSDNSITDAGLVFLPSLKEHLQSLDLSDTRVSDAVLRNLRRLTNLRRLDLGNTCVTDSGVKELQQALPSCAIFR
jgi:hypothetical protein